MGDSLRGEIRSAAMARVLCRANSLLERTMDEEVIYKRLQFLSYELKEHCANFHSQQGLLEGLLDFFFVKKAYSCSRQLHHHTPDHLASTLITTRKAHIEVLATMFCILGHEIQLPLQVLAVNPLRYVRLATSPVVFDLAENGRELSPQDLIEVLQNNGPLDVCNGPAYLDTSELLVSYLTHLKECPPCADDLNLQLALQTQLIELCPDRISLYGERAMTHYHLGHNPQAMKDLKRYFSFRDKESGPQNLVTLMTELEAL